MATLNVSEGKLRANINPKRFYRFIEVDPHQGKKIVSEVFEGKHYSHYFPENMNGFAYEIERMRHVPGKHELKTNPRYEQSTK